jgi:alpha-galactosidase
MALARTKAILLTAAMIAGGLAGSVIAAQPAATLGNGLALTPPMGWNDWNAYGCNVSETLVKQTADKFVSSGLAAAGYKYVNIDDCWMQHSRDGSGNLQPDFTKFPDGISGTAAYVHSKGLKLGIYEDAGTATCAGFPGSLGHEQQDANLFASWGVDYLKYDNCNNNGSSTTAQYIARYSAMRDALARTGRPIVYSVCEWGINSPWTWAGDVGNLWRTTGDISANFSSMLSIFHANVGLASFAGPGKWNDPDMLEVGNGMSATEDRAHFSLWAEMAAPLLAGDNLVAASATTLSILGNTRVIAVDQDSLGRQGTMVSSSGGRDVLAKPLANGDVSVVLFNESATTQTISTTAAAIGKTGAASYSLTDLWSGATSSTTGTISASVPGHGVVMYRVAGGTTSTTTAYEAEASSSTLAGAAVRASCSGCSGAQKVGWIGNGAANYVTVNGINVTAAGSHTLTVYYTLSGSRSFSVSVNGRPDIVLNLTGSDWSTAVATTLTVTLNAGANTIKFHNDSAFAPDLDRITVT